MYSVLQKLIDEIKQTANVDVTVFHGDGGTVAAKTAQAEHVFAMPLQEFSQDKEHNQTMLKYTRKGENLVLVVSGINPVSVNIVKMCGILLDNLFDRYAKNVGKLEIVQAILRGEYTGLDIRYLKRKFSISNGNYFVLAIGAETKNFDDIINYLSIFSTSDDDIYLVVDNDCIAYLKYCAKGDNINSSIELAKMLADNINTELNIKVSVCAGNMAKGAESFFECWNQAQTGLRTGKLLAYGKNAFSFKEFLLADLISKLPSSAVEKCKRELINESISEVLRDETLIETAEAFMAESLNISETARTMYVHRNTLMYRLDKIEKETGLNIRNFADAVTFRIFKLIYKI